MVRTFPIYRETNLDFRAEYFDVLNHTKLGNPNTSESNAAFGPITSSNPSADAERIAQFSSSASSKTGCFLNRCFE